MDEETLAVLAAAGIDPALFAQQDATAFRPGTRTGANPIRSAIGMGLDLVPGVGDIKGLLESPGLFRSGHPVAGAISMASSIPFAGIPLDILKVFSKQNRVFKAAADGTGISNPAVTLRDQDTGIVDLFYAKGAANHTAVMHDPDNLDAMRRADGDNRIRDLTFGFIDDTGDFLDYDEAAALGVSKGQIHPEDAEFLTSESFELTGEAKKANDAAKAAYDAMVEKRRIEYLKRFSEGG